METTQGISLCSSLYLKLPKMPCFFFNLSGFFFNILTMKMLEIFWRVYD
jgi:hypothetical protein